MHALQPVPVQQQPIQAAQAAEHVFREQPQAVPVQEEVAQVGQVREQVILGWGRWGAGGEEESGPQRQVGRRGRRGSIVLEWKGFDGLIWRVLGSNPASPNPLRS